jgi:hypothetical protein
MRDLTQRDGGRAPYVSLSFAIADLLLVQNWADRHKFRISIRLDYGVEVGEDFEEVIAFQTSKSPLYRLVMWRDAETVFVQPHIGKKTQHGSVTEALEDAISGRVSAIRRPRRRLTPLQPPVTSATSLDDATH